MAKTYLLYGQDNNNFVASGLAWAPEIPGRLYYTSEQGGNGTYYTSFDVTNYKTLEFDSNGVYANPETPGYTYVKLIIKNADKDWSRILAYPGTDDIYWSDPTINIPNMTIDLAKEKISGTITIGFEMYGTSGYPVNNIRPYCYIQNPVIYLTSDPMLEISKGTGISSVTGEGAYPKNTAVSIDATVSPGYTWSKWSDNDSENGIDDTSYLKSSVSTKANSLTMPDTDLSLKANAIANKYTITFNANGGTTSTTSKSVTYNSTYGTLPTPSRTGYSFNGWYTATNGGKKKTSSSTYTIIGNSTLYAQWTPIKYTIVFNANGGTGSMNNMTCSYNTTYTLTANAFTRKNYTFMGWATSANGSVVYKDKASVKNLKNTATTITLYAVWQQQGTVQIMVDNVFKTAQAYVFKDGFWLLAQPWTYSSGWKINGG